MQANHAETIKSGAACAIMIMVAFFMICGALR